MNSPNSLSPSAVNAYLDGAFTALKRAARKVAAASRKEGREPVVSSNTPTASDKVSENVKPSDS